MLKKVSPRHRPPRAGLALDFTIPHLELEGIAQNKPTEEPKLRNMWLSQMWRNGFRFMERADPHVALQGHELPQ